MEHAPRLAGLELALGTRLTQVLRRECRARMSRSGIATPLAHPLAGEVEEGDYQVARRANRRTRGEMMLLTKLAFAGDEPASVVEL